MSRRWKIIGSDAIMLVVVVASMLSGDLSAVERFLSRDVFVDLGISIDPNHTEIFIDDGALLASGSRNIVAGSGPSNFVEKVINSCPPIIADITRTPRGRARFGHAALICVPISSPTSLA